MTALCEADYGRKCTTFVKSKFKQVENTGVIAAGQGGSLINLIGILQTSKRTTDSSFPLCTIRLFDKPRWKCACAGNALPRSTEDDSAGQYVGEDLYFGERMVINVISGGMSSPNDFQVCGLVELFLAAASDASDDFDSGPKLDCSLGKSSAVLSVVEWSKLPASRERLSKTRYQVMHTFKEVME